MKKLKQIMLLDDNKTDNIIHAYHIQQLGIASQISVYTNADDALAYLECEIKEDDYSEPELILLDYALPQKNGMAFLEVFNQLYALRSSKPTCVWLTVYPRELFQHTGLAYIPKPITKEALWEVYMEYCQQHRLVK